MEKICNQCKQSFTQKANVRGSEQKYCSIKCRQTSAQLRMINKIKESAKHENENEIKPISNGIESINSHVERRDKRIIDGGEYISDIHLSIIEKLYETKSEVIFYKLRCENLQKENAQLLIDISNLEQELEEDESEEKSGYEGMLGGVMEQFKQDPVNTINFATELIGTLFKSKTRKDGSV